MNKLLKITYPTGKRASLKCSASELEKFKSRIEASGGIVKVLTVPASR
jgi:hypothetical protein